MTVELRFINQSAAVNGCDVILFQRNVATDLRELAVAWKVIRYCGLYCYHPFKYEADVEVSISDDDGNHSPRVTASDGQRLSVSPTPYGRRLSLQGDAACANEIEVANDLPQGAINVNVYKSGLLVARKTAVAPQQKAVFQFKPLLRIAAVSAEQGENVTSAVMSGANTELSLLGVASADIVMTGGGGGRHANPFVFRLENVIPA